MDNADFANRINRRCQLWFEYNKTEAPPDELFIELTLVESHLLLESIAGLPADEVKAHKQSQRRDNRIARIEEILKKYPELVKHVRSDLTLLWQYYAPELGT